jgi:hypothetical protein
MEMLTFTQLAQLTDLAPPTVRRYLDDYILYVPSVRIEGNFGFPAEAVAAIRTIHGLTDAGHSHTEITHHLESLYPITVITSQPLGEGQDLPPLVPTISALLQDVDERYRVVHTLLAEMRNDLGKLPTEQRIQQVQQLITSTATTTFHHFDALDTVPSDLVQIKQAIGVLATRLERATSRSREDQQALTFQIETLAAQITASATLPTTALAAIRAEVSEVRQTVGIHAIGAGATTADVLRPELDGLKLQIAELRQERGQMLSLMAALQDNLVQLHMELADARQTTKPSKPSGSSSAVNGASHLKAVPQPADAEADDDESATDKLRTPRRLGHITGR